MFFTRFPIPILRALPLVIAGAALFDLLAPDAQAGMGSFFSGLATRSRVVQVCIATMAVALFILMKKFAPHKSD